LPDAAAVDDALASQAQIELSAGIPFVSDADLHAALDSAGVPTEAADEISDLYAEARLTGLRTSLSVLALLALVALAFTRRIPTTPTGSSDSGQAPVTS
jgi:hypothetical protein